MPSINAEWTMQERESNASDSEEEPSTLNQAGNFPQGAAPLTKPEPTKRYVVESDPRASSVGKVWILMNM